MNTLLRVCQVFVLSIVALWALRELVFATVEPGQVGVRQSNVTGVLEEDLEPGWHWRVPGVHRVIMLPGRYAFLDYTSEQAGPHESLQIRTRDNNNVILDVSVPYRIIPGEAYEVVKAGNHAQDANGLFRYQRLAQETTVSVLREGLAELTSRDFYATDRRLEVSASALGALNLALAALHLEAEAVLVRQVSFRPEYENQLQQIQLNEQNKLLDRAKERVAKEQQTLDNFLQGTKALASAREQDWIKRQAELERAYQVGFLDTGADQAPGAARRQLAALPEAELVELRKRAATVFGATSGDELPTYYLLGIKNVEAETLEYKQRIHAEADGVADRLDAEAGALVAEVQGDYETRVNALLSTQAGRAYVAWQAAANVHFAESLTFRSSDGIPSVLRLYEFALDYMGRTR